MTGVMEMIECPLVRNRCFTSQVRMRPRGVMVHSTGVNNPELRRYVQPVEGQGEYGRLMRLLGRNQYGNHWNRPMYGKDAKCVHAFIGRLADGSVGTVRTLPWDVQAWHCGGSANGTHMSFEMCEDDLRDPVYFGEVYRAAVQLAAYLCGSFGLDPLEDGVVICHKEGARRGIASDHSDVEPWFGAQGKTMDGFRRDVAESMKGDENMTGEDIYRLLSEYTSELGLPDWARAEFTEAVRAGITDGSDPMGIVPRYQAAIMALRAMKAGGAGKVERDV